MKLSLVIFCIFMIFPKGVRADTCYPADVVVADASLRFHARLRVIGLSCTSPQSHQTMFPYYQTFTTNNGDLLKQYQDTLTVYYGKKGKGDSAKKLHTRETDLENEESLAAAKQSTSAFCRQHEPDLERIVLQSPTEVKQEIETFAAADPSALKPCSASHTP